MTQTKEKMIISRTHYNNRFVAVEGAVNDWACYVGKKSDTVEKIKAYGDKIGEEEARELFPEIEQLRWRP